VVPDATSALHQAAVVARVQPPTLAEVAALPAGVSTISFLQPIASADVVKALADKGATVYSLDLLPRISRAQSMDALSSQATVAGYRAGLAAAEHLAKFFPMFMTAAGTVPPAKVLVMGAGVAGLQAIATARRLGAVVRAYDVRAAAKEEVQSLGAKFVELDLETQDGAGGYAREQSAEYLAKQQELLAAEVAASDVVITTAQIPGRKAPVLVTTAMVDGMSEGSVIVDLAADSGGNCELSVAGEDVLFDGVTIVGLSNPPASMPTHASFLYARNIANFLDLLVSEGELAPDFDDEIVVGTCVVRDGTVVHVPTAEALGLATPSAAPPSSAAPSGTGDNPPADGPGGDQSTESEGERP
jgi:NAD(P) transhydrogenase subunit alpha